MVDALASGASARKGVGVQVPPCARVVTVGRIRKGPANCVSAVVSAVLRGCSGPPSSPSANSARASQCVQPDSARVSMGNYARGGYSLCAGGIAQQRCSDNEPSFSHTQRGIRCAGLFGAPEQNIWGIYAYGISGRHCCAQKALERVFCPARGPINCTISGDWLQCHARDGRERHGGR